MVKRDDLVFALAVDLAQILDFQEIHDVSLLFMVHPHNKVFNSHRGDFQVRDSSLGKRMANIAPPAGGFSR
jgi:hypothetical protein